MAVTFLHQAEITPDGLTSAALNTAIADAISSGGAVTPRPGLYVIDSAIAWPSKTWIRGGPDVTFRIDTAGANAFTATGTATSTTALTSDATAGAETVTLPVGHGIVAGDWIGLQSTAVVIPGTPGGRAREIHQVLSATSTTVTLDDSLYWDYTVAATAVFWKITPLTDIHLEGVTLEYADIADPARGIVLTNVTRSTIDVTVVNGPGVFVSDSIGVEVNAFVDGNPIYTDVPYGYGVTIGGASEACTVSGTMRDLRHGVTTLPTQVGADMWTGPYHTKFDHVYARGGSSSFAPLDTHAYAVETLFDGCTGRGPGQASTPALQDRAYKTTINGGDFSGGRRGVTFTSDAIASTLQGASVSILAASAEGAVVVAGDDVTIRGNDITAPAGYGVDNIGDRTLVEKNTIAALSCWRENAGADTGAIFQHNTVYLHSVAGFGGISTARGLQKANTFIEGVSTAVFLSAPGASARMVDDWHAPRATTYAASVTPNPGLHNCLAITLTGNITIANPSANQKIVGNRLRLILTQDGTGTRTTTFGSDFKVSAAWVPVTTANKINIIEFVWNGTFWLETGVTAGLN